jgi:hypothetical protein
MNTSNPLAFSVYWTTDQNKNGTKPPNPQFIKKADPEYVQVITNLPSAYVGITNPVGVIQSNRTPYAVEHVNNGYGQLSTKLGTNMGS